MDLGLAQQHALVIGGSGGIGQAVCRVLRQEGAVVTVGDQRTPADGEASRFVTLDLADERSVRDGVAAAEAWQPLDILVNAAGIFSDTPLLKLGAAQWDRTFVVNVRGVFITCQEALRRMVERRRGVIVTVASLAGQVGGLASGPDYAASKAALAGFSKSLARLAGPYGVRVNLVNPGIVRTPMTADWRADLLAELTRQTPLGRLASAEEVAQVIVLLCSRAMSFVHGTHIDVNGGLYLD